MKQTKLYGVARANKIEIKRFAKFAIVGFTGLIVDYVLLNLLTYFGGMEEWLAIGVAFAIVRRAFGAFPRPAGPAPAEDGRENVRVVRRIE